ncbi:MAG: RagB/SusD family nutrient uptake outer membrane protein [Bacteroidota bacterium]
MKARLALIILITGLIVQSCDLNEQPYGFYSDDNFYKTAADAESAVLYAYNTLNFIEYSRGIFYIGELASDICDVKSGEAYGSQDLNNWKTEPTNETLTYFFKYCYIGINRANAVIENVENSDFDEAAKNKLLGEAYFLRAYHYFNLVRVYGLVPIQREMVKTVAQTTPEMAQNLDEIYDMINADFRKAAELLQIDRCVGRADRVAAQAFLAKSYLTIASAKESGATLYTAMNKDVATMYDSAVYFAGQVLNDQTEYSLDPDLLDIYDVENPTGPEHIFIMSMDVSGTDEGEYSKIGMMFHPWVAGVPYYIKNPDGSLKLCTNGWEVFKTTESFYTSYAANDKRRTDLLVTQVFDASGNLAGQKGIDFTYAFPRKYVDSNFSGQKSSVRPYLMRFSEVALIYAEAAGPTTEGYYWINQIRGRAGISDLTEGLETAAFRDSVVQERAWELAFEGQRLYDLRRKAMVLDKDPRAVSAGITEEQAAFYAIPQLETDLNPNVSGN